MADRESLSPAVRRMVEEFQLNPDAITGTGREGRITKEDVVRHLESLKAVPAQPARVAPKAPPPAVPSPAAGPTSTTPLPGERETRKPMSPLRQRIAERLLEAKQTTAMLTTFNEADMTNVFALRAKHKQAFKEKHDINLGFMSFFVKACVDALQAVPQLNARIEGNDIVENHYYDIGVAISSDKGLVVPVVRDADRLSFAGVEIAIADLAERVRAKKITLADLSGAVFTISNGGVFGSLLSTPILNPPQSGILGMHAIKKRPVVVEDEIVIRPMMYLAMSYDHRVVDGREAVTFLKRIVECIENPERMMLEV
jgi:2-oxoglutarate dehydrogenase E2 component (dihydrolipoamide succinyltransferase)